MLQTMLQNIEMLKNSANVFKEISKNILPSKDISQTVTTNMDDLVDEIKDYDSQMKSEFSEMKKQESFRREFIGNLAHEIKTPLFTSQSYFSRKLRCPGHCLFDRIHGA